jgi:phosphoglycolate phosphatase
MGTLAGITLAFDLDGTLVDTAPDLIAATNHVLASDGLEPVAATVLRDQISFGARAMISRGLALRDAVRTTAEIDALHAAFLRHYTANIAVHSRPFPQVAQVLDRYRAHGCRLAVCTNKREDLARSLLGQLDLLSLFDAVAGGDTFAVSKPHPDHLTGAITQAGGMVRRAVMIGDSDTDIATARAAGLPSIAVSFGYTDVPAAQLGATTVIDHFNDFDAALAMVVRHLPPAQRSSV